MGTVVISIDAELGWGFHDLADPPTERVENGRRGWWQLLRCFERHDVPATWAIVGHLVLAECDGVHALHPAPADWFRREREEWADRPDLRFGRTLVRATIDSSVDHEIACHSFSHVEFGREETTRELARVEVETCLALAEEWGHSLTSFVYPRNDVGHRDVLAECGLTCYRGVSPTADGVRGVIDAATRGTSHLVTPRIDEHGLVDVPASLFLFGFQGPTRDAVSRLWEDPMVWLARRGIDQAATSDGVFHVWLHPNNLVDERDDRRMEDIVAYLAERRDAGDVEIATMGEVAARTLGDDENEVEDAPSRPRKH